MRRVIGVTLLLLGIGGMATALPGLGAAAPGDSQPGSSDDNHTLMQAKPLTVSEQRRASAMALADTRVPGAARAQRPSVKEISPWWDEGKQEGIGAVVWLTWSSPIQINQDLPWAEPSTAGANNRPYKKMSIYESADNVKNLMVFIDFKTNEVVRMSLGPYAHLKYSERH